MAVGHDAVHTLGLPERDRSADETGGGTADAGGQFLINEDGDSRDSHGLHASSRRLLIVATGNLSNGDLQAIFARHLGLLVAALESAGRVEFGQEHVPEETEL